MGLRWGRCHRYDGWLLGLVGRALHKGSLAAPTDLKGGGIGFLTSWAVVGADVFVCLFKARDNLPGSVNVVHIVEPDFWIGVRKREFTDAALGILIQQTTGDTGLCQLLLNKVGGLQIFGGIKLEHNGA